MMKKSKAGVSDSMSNKGVLAFGWAAVITITLWSAFLLTGKLMIPDTQPIDTQYEPGAHFLFVFVAPMREQSPEFQGSVKIARDSARAFAERHSRYYSTVGVSLQWDVAKGVDQLAEYGHFDEIIVGRNWLNTGVAAFLSQLDARMSVPQIVVLEQTAHVRGQGLRFGTASELLRVYGTAGIGDWAAEGAQLSEAGLDPASLERDD